MFVCVFICLLVCFHVCLYSFIHSITFIALFSPLLLRGAPDSSTVNKNSFKTIIECVEKRPIDGRRNSRGSLREAIIDVGLYCIDIIRYV